MDRADTRGRQRVARMVYEVVSFQVLREQLRCREIKLDMTTRLSIRTTAPASGP